MPGTIDQLRLIRQGGRKPDRSTYCLDVHTGNAKKAGATREEVAEAALLAAALWAGAAVTHGALAVKLFDRP